MRRLDVLVAQPHGDHREIDSRLEEVHRRRVPDRMRREVELAERGIFLRGEVENGPQTLIDPGAGHVPTSGVRKQRSVAHCRNLLEPVTEEADRLAPKRDRALFASLPTEVNRSSGREGEVADLESSQLRNASSGVVHESQQHSISKSCAGGHIWGIEQRLNLVRLQVADDFALVPLAGNRQNSLGDRQKEWIGCGREAKERANCRQPRVAGSRAVVAPALKVVEEGQHALGIDAVHSKVIRLEAELSIEESQEQLEGVPVRRDRAGAEPSLVDQVLAEVALQDRAEESPAPSVGAFIANSRLARRSAQIGLRPLREAHVCR